jgi:signal transduction histidine kinase
VIEVPEISVIEPGSNHGRLLQWAFPLAIRASIFRTGAGLVACGLIALVFSVSWDAYRVSREAAESITGARTDGPQEIRSNDDVSQRWLFIGLGLGAVAGLLAGLLNAQLRRRTGIANGPRARNTALMTILREMPDGVQVFNRDGELIAWNEQAFILNDLDTKQQQAIVTAPDRARAFRYMLARRGDYGPGDPDDLVAAREGIARSGQPMQRRRQGASGRWIEVRGVPTTDGGWLGSYRDISNEVAREHELTEAYERFRSAKEDAEKASRIKSAFLANMSHELRTPLNAIMGFSYMIRDGMVRSEEEVRSYSSDIYTSGQHLLQLINDILDVSRIEAGKLALEDEAVDLAVLLDGALRMIESEAARARVVIDRAYGKSLPKVLADRRRVSQVLLNLLSNAVKFTPGGGTVQVSLWRDRDAVGISVADTGIGIAAKDIPVVLQPFGQVDSQLSRKYSGTGLGLPLSVRLMQLHGGTLEIESEVGAGTTVTIAFPAHRVLPDSRVAAPSDARQELALSSAAQCDQDRTVRSR